MTDLERLKSLLDDWDVPYKEDSTQAGDGTEITVGLGEDSPKVKGYIFFYTLFEFAPDGTFRLMGAWE